jgi:dTMP kinase
MYIAFEGIDTAGKTTQLKALAERLENPLLTKEPGATPLGKEVRRILLHGEAPTPRAETLLFLADRAEHIARVIAPNRPRWILSDRSLVSGIAYAHVHAGIDLQTLISLNRFATGDVLPDRVVFLQLHETALRARLRDKQPDTIERRGIGFMLEVQTVMEEVIDRLALPVLKLDASISPEILTETIYQTIVKESSR